jgi:myosin heavy subunit
VDEVEHEIDPKEATPFEPSHAQDLPNMVMMSNLHEAPLLYLLQRRLKEAATGGGNVYTWAGDVLISLNPYKIIPSLYQVSTYLDGGKELLESPHVYAIAKRAYAALQSTSALSPAAQKEAAADGLHVAQSVLISGESGAGKTEAAKRVLEFLTAASRRRKELREAGVVGRDNAASQVTRLDMT